MKLKWLTLVLLTSFCAMGQPGNGNGQGQGNGQGNGGGNGNGNGNGNGCTQPPCGGPNQPPSPVPIDTDLIFLAAIGMGVWFKTRKHRRLATFFRRK